MIPGSRVEQINVPERYINATSHSPGRGKKWLTTNPRPSNLERERMRKGVETSEKLRRRRGRERRNGERVYESAAT